MNHLISIIKRNKLIYHNRNYNNNFILSKNKDSPLSFIEITSTQYRFVYDTLNDEVIAFERLNHSPNTSL